MPRVIVVPSEEQGAQLAADILQPIEKEAIAADGVFRFGTATGGSPLAFYLELIQRAKDGRTRPESWFAAQLDEYAGVPAHHELSYRRFMDEHLFDGLVPYGLDKANTHVPNGMAPDPQAEAERYDQLLLDNPIHLQTAGIGRDGHIAFAEPGTPLESTTLVVDLNEMTLRDNVRYCLEAGERWEDGKVLRGDQDVTDQAIDRVPKQAISQGPATVMRAKQVTLFAWGAGKADAIHAALEQTPSPQCTTSVLQNHPNAVFILDAAAAEKLTIGVERL